MALGVIIAQLIASFVAALAALGSVVFSWAGLALIVGEAGITTGMIVAAVGLALEHVAEARARQQLQRAAEAGDDVEHLLAQDMSGAQSRMPGKWNFFHRRENPHIVTAEPFSL